MTSGREREGVRAAAGSRSCHPRPLRTDLGSAVFGFFGRFRPPSSCLAVLRLVAGLTCTSVIHIISLEQDITRYIWFKIDVEWEEKLNIGPDRRRPRF